MAGKPKRSDYAAGPAEKMNASVAVHQENYRMENYGPLALHERDKADTEQYAEHAQGMANAEYQQMNKPSLMASRSVDSVADAASNSLAILTSASGEGEKMKQDRKLNVLAYATDSMMQNQTSMQNLAEIENTDTILRADAETRKRDRNVKLGMQMVSNVKAQGELNKADGYSFWGGPGDPQTQFNASAHSRRHDWKNYGNRYSGDAPKGWQYGKDKGRSLWQGYLSELSDQFLGGADT